MITLITKMSKAITPRQQQSRLELNTLKFHSSHSLVSYTTAKRIK